MEDNKFFRYVWRVNGLILLVAGLLAIGLLGFAGYEIHSNEKHDRNTRNPVNVQDGEEAGKDWYLGDMSDVQGTPYVMVTLISDQSVSRSNYSRSKSSARNYLFINSKNNHQQWLLPSNSYLIAETDMLSEYGYGSDERKIRAILYLIVKADTDKNNRLTSEDLKTISVSHPDGSGYRELVAGVDHFVGYRVVDEDSLLLVYLKKGIGFSANVSLTTLTLSNEQRLPQIPALVDPQG